MTNVGLNETQMKTLGDIIAAQKLLAPEKQIGWRDIS